MSTRKYQNNKIEWRRSKVRELLAKGYNHYEIANTLQIPRPTITKDIQYLRQQDKENLQTHIEERLPHEYENCMAGIIRVLQLTWEIAEKPTDDKTKLQAFAQLSEGYKYLMELATNGAVVTDAVKYVNQKKEQLEKLEAVQKIDERIEEMEDEDKTTSGVF